MPKRIVILDPNGVEVAGTGNRHYEQSNWEDIVDIMLTRDLAPLLKRENPKLGTYTVTVKEVE